MHFAARVSRKRGLAPSAVPVPFFALNRTDSEQNRDGLPTSRTLSRFCSGQRTGARISPHRLPAAGAIRIQFVFQVVKDQLSSSVCSARKSQQAGNPRSLLKFSTYDLHKTTLSPLRRLPRQTAASKSLSLELNCQHRRGDTDSGFL